MVVEMIEFVIKRNGSKEKFHEEKVKKAIWNAIESVNGHDKEKFEDLTKFILHKLKKTGKKEMSVEEIQDIVEESLIKRGHDAVAKSFIIYRHQHEMLRNFKNISEDTDLIDAYLSKGNWAIKENSNMDFSLQGLNNNAVSKIMSTYWLNKVFPPEISKLHYDGDFHVHDLGSLSAYCFGLDLRDLLLNGFGGVSSKIESGPPKHFRSTLGQIVNYLYTIQGEVSGAVALSNFDTYLAPFIREDNLNEEEVKQALQEFIFNMNVPTRVGYQCLSEDTEILTDNGWESYENIKIGDKIKTFNIKNGDIETKPVLKMFKKHYNGKMYNLKNRIQDQLISPNHRVVRRKYSSNKFILEPIEDVINQKSVPIIPIFGKNNNKGINLSEDEIKLIAWVISEGTKEKKSNKYRTCGRISIYQSKKKNKKEYEKITKILNNLNLSYKESEGVPALGESVTRLRLNAESSRKVSKYFDYYDIKHVPSNLLKMNKKQANIFIDTYLNADGDSNSKIYTTNKNILDGLQEICLLSEKGFTTLIRKPNIGTKDIYVLRLINHQDTYITKINKVNYNGIIWCPTTINQTVIARRNGKVFVTGNSPFSNITLDLKIPKHMEKLPIIIGGKIKNTNYGDYQEEMDIFNKILFEIYIKGDEKGKVFTFPIPTINIDKNFDWDNPAHKNIWEATAKYGIPYFGNYINSDMNPEDATSMCCRLKIDHKNLNKRGGGVFSAHPLTGSISVCTINMPRIGYLSRDETDYFKRLDKLMDNAALMSRLRRKFIERWTAAGLYPMSKIALRHSKEASGEYWHNHFNTIGLNGMNESCLNFLGKPITSKKGKDFAIKVLTHMRERLEKYKEEDGQEWNLEETPAEGATRRFAKQDKEKFNDIIVANEDKLNLGATPYYTNSSHEPVNSGMTLFDALKHQDDLKKIYNGGTVKHIFLGEGGANPNSVKNLIKKILNNYSIPYISITPTFSVCPLHGYISGNHKYCPKCLEVGDIIPKT
jgi:ribonucleoside-triphosphate reductase (formate)